MCIRDRVTAIRNFIQQEVDYILLAPVTETGWDTVLQEAKDAGIPVIIVDPVSYTHLFLRKCLGTPSKKSITGVEYYYEWGQIQSFYDNRSCQTGIVIMF